MRKLLLLLVVGLSVAFGGFGGRAWADPPARALYCAPSGAYNLLQGQESWDAHYSNLGLVPAAYVEGVGLTCVVPAGYTRAVGPLPVYGIPWYSAWASDTIVNAEGQNLGTGDPGRIYPYYARSGT